MAGKKSMKRFSLSITTNNKGPRVADVLSMVEDILRSMCNKGWIDAWSLEYAQPEESARDQNTSAGKFLN